VAEWDALKFVLRFAVHIVLGCLIFALVAASTIGLHWVLNKILDGSPGFPYVREALESAELFIFAADLMCVAAFVVKETWLLLRSLVTTAKAPNEA